MDKRIDNDNRTDDSLKYYKVPPMRDELAHRIAAIPLRASHSTAYFMRFAITALLLMISVFAGIKTASIAFKPKAHISTVSRNEFREMFELYGDK